jgi:hypothetical protein
MVVVPTARTVEDPGRFVYEEGPWRTAGTPEAPVIEVFTSAEAFHTAFPEAETSEVPVVTMPLVLLLGVLPVDCALAVNPRTELAVDLPADQVVSLLLWTPEGEEHEADAELGRALAEEPDKDQPGPRTR